METRQDDMNRDRIVQGIAESLRHQAFSVEYKVKKKPMGIVVTFEVTQEEMDEIINKAQRHGDNQS